MKALLSFGISLLAFMIVDIVKTIGKINQYIYEDDLERYVMYFIALGIAFTIFGIVQVVSYIKRNDKK